MAGKPRKQSHALSPTLHTWLAERRLVIAGLVASLDPSTPDAKAIHDLRVATRRLRSVLRIWRDHLPTATSRRAGRELMRELNELRDLDVLAARVANANNPHLKPALDALSAKRVTVAARAVSAVRETHWPALDAALSDLLARHTDTGGNSAATALKAAHAEFKDKLRKAARKPVARRLHDLRIAGKRLRYGLELHARSAREMLRALEVLQDALGDFLDAKVGAATVKALRGSGFDEATGTALGALAESLAADARERRKALPSALKAAEQIRWKKVKETLPDRSTK